MLFPKENMNRNIRNTSKVKRLFIVNLMHAVHPVICESYLEFYGNKILDMQKTTKQMTTQPLTTAIPFCDSEHDATPDTLILNIDETFCLYEFKYEDDYQKNKDRYDNIGNKYISTGIVNYQVLTDNYVYQQPRLINSLELHRIAMSNAAEIHHAQQLRKIMGNNKHRLGEIHKRCTQENIPIQALWYLMGRLIIDIDCTVEFTRKTLINWSQDHEI